MHRWLASAPPNSRGLLLPQWRVVSEVRTVAALGQIHVGSKYSIEPSACLAMMKALVSTALMLTVGES